MTDRLDAATTAVLGLHIQKHMTHADSPVAQHLGFSDMVEKTNLFEKTNRVLNAAREAGLFVAFVSADLSPSGYRYPQRGEFCRFPAKPLRQNSRGDTCSCGSVGNQGGQVWHLAQHGQFVWDPLSPMPLPHTAGEEKWAGESLHDTC